MRILYWVGQVGSKFGGFERYNILVAEKCHARGHEIVMMHDNPNTEPEYNNQLALAHSKQVAVGSTYKNPCSAMVHAAKFIRAWKPQVAHVHFASPLCLPLIRCLGVQVIYQTWHNSIDHHISLRTRLIRHVGKYCTTRMLAVSNGVREDEIRAGVPPLHIRTLYLGVPLRDFTSTANGANGPRPAFIGSGEQRVIITVARFYPQKGMKYVVEAAIKVLRDKLDVSWWLVGDGPERAELEESVRRAGFSDRILFLGLRNDVSFLMSKAYVHVMGSLFEGLPLVAMEAAAAGVPTVGTRIVGLDEAVLDGVTGLLVPRELSEALANGVVQLLDNPDLRDRLANAAKQRVFAQFDSGKLVDDLLDMYEIDTRLTDPAAGRRKSR